VARLLVADDDLQQLALRKLLLEASGHEVSTAGTAADAGRLLAEVRPNLLLMDLRLPKLKDGLALIHAAAERDVKIIVLSGWGEELCDMPEHQLVAEVLAKPVSHEQLLEVIKQVLA
jgi:DNA-binding NtrC family response regulator